MSKQQTAVEWFKNEIPEMFRDDPYWRKLLEQAKAMEKEQIIKAADHIMIYDNKGNYPTLGEIYYKDTYES